jgi:hypothetical protein
MYQRNSMALVELVAGLCFVATIVAGCAAGTIQSNIPCPNGPEVACTCDDGQTGTRQCLNKVYSACACGAAGSWAGAAGSSTNAMTTGAGGNVARATGGRVASAAGAGGAQATTTRGTGAAGKAGNTAKTGPTAGAGGGAPQETKVTCPSSKYVCVTNNYINGVMGIGGAAWSTVTFCAYADDNIFQMAGSTPPTCHTDDNCKALGMNVPCTQVDLGGLLYNGCFLVGCELE